MPYKHILVALDLSEESISVAAKAQSLANKFGAQISLVHVIEPITLGYGIEVPVNLTNVESHIEEQTVQRLRQLCEQFSISPSRCHQVYGRPASEIHRLAEENNADLIVVGSHGRSGIGLLMGSTANAVLHGAKCDVLAVRVGKDK